MKKILISVLMSLILVSPLSFSSVPAEESIKEEKTVCDNHDVLTGIKKDLLNQYENILSVEVEQIFYISSHEDSQIHSCLGVFRVYLETGSLAFPTEYIIFDFKSKEEEKRILEGLGILVPEESLQSI